MATPIEIILEMINVIVDETVTVMFRLLTLYGELFQAVGVSSQIGGPLGLLVSFGTLAVVGYFIGKLVFGGGKKVIILIVLAMLLTFFAIAGFLS